ncbi:Stk1 family PASTA domain-containing Ser/Thr kinase [Longirhabdus pacifica]|uniref:Stk1 family PASTA domain-containing Ser/Thr kinase n=1 Tax=Longirhabdus pacifica TaxID=2305227 RepID=UPI0013E8DA92|nr:Stk1 family PASTA domain-containing Ser/Thr kinase [Longirhabdus pacifica]
MIGSQLAGRYEIESRVGGGGMAIVYKARDILLNRNVAVKMLRNQYVHDEEFVKRFQREAQSAASLSHHNIVNIYDVGQEEDVHYIIMEYVDGKNLKEKIEEQAPLQVDEAIHIAEQICDALLHAHQNMIIHRDIKPHNILLGSNGRVKVTDFGIARAVTSTDITQTGAVLGSVHYFSPEQAKGTMQGVKSDLYSLGIVLYQMLTNSLPFKGESPISVALKHLQEKVEEPKQLNPLIPQSVENIILKALRKNPEERYQSAGEMLEDLRTCLNEERQYEKKVTYHDEVDDEATIVMPAISNRHTNSEQQDTMAFSSASQDADENHKEHRSNKKWVKPLIWVSSIFLLVMASWIGINAIKASITVPEVVVPDLINKSEEEAKQLLLQNNLVLGDITEENSEDIEAGDVISQSMKAGMSVRENSEIDLTISTGVEMVEMPDWTLEKWEDVQSSIITFVGDQDRIDINAVKSEEEAGTIIKQSPRAGKEISIADSEFRFTVSEGPGTVTMPDIINKDLEEATLQLEELGLVVDEDIQYLESYEFEKDHVMETSPYKAGDEKVPLGQEIRLYVSSGYAEDAISYSHTINVSPAEEGEVSQIRIVYSDATTVDGSPIEWGVRDISSDTSFNIDVILTKTTPALIEIQRDNKFLDKVTVTFENATDGTSSSTEDNTDGGSE